MEVAAIPHELQDHSSSLDCDVSNPERTENSEDLSDADRLTDSNSSEKSPPPVTDETICSDQDSNVPLNFPVRGKIIARLQGKGFEYFMTKPKIVIGRDSSKGNVDINMGHSNFISRNHLEIVHDGNDFLLSCGGKNGVFVDDCFQKIGAPYLKLPKSCTLRFPSTQIVILFEAAECFIDQYSTNPGKLAESLQCQGDGPINKTLQGLKVQIPSSQNVNGRKPRFFSPCPSPTGTISAVNSAPASPNGTSRNVTVFSRKAIRTSASHGFSLTGEASPVKDDRIPISADVDVKPPFSYAQLIVQAISSASDRQMTLSGIYAYISRNYPYYRAHDKGWQNSIRHNLSLNRYFVKVARSQDEPGKGCFWTIDPASEPKLVAQAFRRRNKRGVPYFRGAPSGIISQSAPASPTRVSAASNIPTSRDAESLQAATNNRKNNNHDIKSSIVHKQLGEIKVATNLSHIIDVSNGRGFQSAPGSPQAYKLISPTSLIAASKVLAKDTQPSRLAVATAANSNKSTSITLLQPFTTFQTGNVGSGGLVTLSAAQPIQIGKATQLLTTGSSILMSADALQVAAAGAKIPISSVKTTTSIQVPLVQAVPTNRQPLLLQVKRTVEQMEDKSSDKPVAAKCSKLS